jgi:type I restriction enzyme R subunit
VSKGFTESTVEDAALAGGRRSAGVAHDIAPEMLAAERRDYGEGMLGTRLRDALARLNPTLPAAALGDAFRKLTRPEGADLIHHDRASHRLLLNGVTVEYRRPEGDNCEAQARDRIRRPCQRRLARGRAVQRHGEQA